MTLSHWLYALAVALAFGTVLSALVTWHELAYRRAKPLILSLLDTGTPGARIGCTGMDFVRRSKGKLGRATVYVWLSRMEDEGLIESEPESGLSASVQAIANLLDESQHDPALYGRLREPPRRRIYRLKEQPCGSA